VSFNPALNYNANFTVTTSVSDGVAQAITGSKSFSTDTPVNDAPTASGVPADVTVTEDTASNFDLSAVTVVDVDGDNLTVTLAASAGTFAATSGGGVTVGGSGTLTLTLQGTATDINTYLGIVSNIQYTGALDANGDNAATFTLTANDGTVDSPVYNGNIDITPVNDAPTATNLDTTETYTEDTPLNLTDIVVSDVDSTDVTVTLTLSNTAAGALSTATSNAVTSTFAAGVWTASGAKADVNTLLAGVTFNPALNFNADFTVATSVSDGEAPALTSSKTFTGTPVNDAPTATDLSTAETYTEDTPLNLTDIVVSDVDSANVTVTLTLSNIAAGALSTATSNAVTSTFAAGVWSASGALADVNTLLAGVTFNPALNFHGAFTVATSVSDGEAPPVTGSKTFTGTPVNDAPTGGVSITGALVQGQVLNADTHTLGDVDGLGTLHYQWLRGGVAIAGAPDAAAYTTVLADVGATISLRVSYTDG
jgi:hypothetical protein